MCGDITFEDEKNVTLQGSIRVVYIDANGGEKLAEDKLYKNLSLQEYVYTTIIIDGYDLVGKESRKIQLTVDEPNKITIFTYEKLK